MSRVRVPDVIGRWCLLAALGIWCGSAVGQTSVWPWFLAAATCGLGLCGYRGWSTSAVLLALALVGCLSGLLAVQRATRTTSYEVVEGPTRVAGRMADDVHQTGRGTWFLLEPSEVMVGGEWRSWSGPVLLVAGEELPADVGAGDEVEVTGTLKATAGTARGDSYSAVLNARSVVHTGGPRDPVYAAAGLVRSRVDRALAPWQETSAGGLVAGFLIGDTRGVSDIDEEALRLAGLSHYVAVSGSNVALFLMLWWVVVGPLAMGPKRRAAAGGAGIILFAVVTRWEPSVLRASVMAGIVLIAKAVGFPLSAWSALGIACGALLLSSPELVFDVGFQLSVAATLGVMTGANLFAGRLPQVVSSTLSATVAAQVAVAPVLLLRFGTVPLAAPLANLVAAPAVAFATMAGIVGVTFGWSPLLAASVGGAKWVLTVADHSSGLPQLGPWATTGAAIVLLSLFFERTRLIALSAVGVAALMSILVTPAGVRGPAVIFLDIGQGDAILVLGEAGEVVLMDGGPDGPLLVRKLRQYGVDRVDLMVVSHPHEDHLAGLVPVAERYEVGEIWHPGFVDGGDTFANLMAIAEQKQIATSVPPLGRYERGSLSIAVVGPLRRYVSPNDQSLVLVLGENQVLLPGDIETIAQRELGPLHTSVMKVPHSGSRTSDLDWLMESRPDTAIISVGPNPFGHPAAEVIAALELAGSQVVRTDQAGDVVIQLERPSGSPP